jgi:hypothetical protein
VEALADTKAKRMPPLPTQHPTMFLHHFLADRFSGFHSARIESRMSS